MVRLPESYREKLVFHGITAVAELKPGLGGTEEDRDHVFHGITAVAELKRDLTGGELALEPRFSTASPPWPN